MRNISKLIVLVLFMLSLPCSADIVIDNNQMQNKALREQVVRDFANPQINWAPYMKKITGEMKKNWKPPVGDVSSRIVVGFNVQKSGEITDIEIKSSNAPKEAENIAINTVKSVSGCYPLPEEYDKESVSIEFTFDYNLLGSNSFQSLKQRGANIEPRYYKDTSKYWQEGMPYFKRSR